MTDDDDSIPLEIQAWQAETPLSYHVDLVLTAGEPLTPEQTLQAQNAVWDKLFAIFGSENAVVAAGQADEASESPEAIIHWRDATALAFTAGREKLPPGARADFVIGYYYTS